MAIPISLANVTDQRVKIFGQDHIEPLTEDERQRGRKAIAAARKLRAEQHAKYGTGPASWELLNEARDERTEQLMSGLDV